MRATATVHTAEQNDAAKTEATLICREERISCWDAKHRVWKALDLIGQQIAKTQHPSAPLQQPRKGAQRETEQVKSLAVLRPLA